MQASPWIEHNPLVEETLKGGNRRSAAPPGENYSMHGTYFRSALRTKPKSKVIIFAAVASLLSLAVTVYFCLSRLNQGNSMELMRRRLANSDEGEQYRPLGKAQEKCRNLLLSEEQEGRRESAGFYLSLLLSDGPEDRNGVPRNPKRKRSNSFGNERLRQHKRPLLEGQESDEFGAFHGTADPLEGPSMGPGPLIMGGLYPSSLHGIPYPYVYTYPPQTSGNWVSQSPVEMLGSTRPLPWLNPYVEETAEPETWFPDQFGHPAGYESVGGTIRQYEAFHGAEKQSPILAAGKSTGPTAIYGSATEADETRRTTLLLPNYQPRTDNPKDPDFAEPAEGGPGLLSSYNLLSRLSLSSGSTWQSAHGNLQKDHGAQTAIYDAAKSQFFHPGQVPTDNTQPSVLEASVSPTSSEPSPPCTGECFDDLFYARHLFYRLPTADMGGRTLEFDWETALLNPTRLSLVQVLKPIRQQLLKPRLDYSDLRTLLRLAERLVSYGACTRTIGTGRISPAYLAGPLGRRFITMDYLWSIFEVTKVETINRPWWQSLMERLSDVNSVMFPTVSRADSRFQFVLRLRSAMHQYKEGKRPPAREVVELKQELFCRENSPTVFKRHEWDPWRQDNIFAPEEN